jgi:predicted neuraminidase
MQAGNLHHGEGIMGIMPGLLVPFLIAAAADVEEIRIEKVVGPEVPHRYKHPAAITQLDNGDLIIAYHGGDGEYHEDTAVYATRLKAGGAQWTAPAIIADTPFHGDGNPVIWQGPGGMVWLFYVVRYGKTWSDSRIHCKVSRDGAQTWSDSFVLAFEPGMMVRNQPIVLTNGDYLLPVYHEKGNDPEFVAPESTSLFLRYHPKAREWTRTPPIRSRLGNIQPGVVQLTDQHLVCYCRRGGGYEGRSDGYLVTSESLDGGKTWAPGRDSAFPNPNAAVDFLKLASGNLLLVYNDSMKNRTPLTAALSTDGGKTFPYRRNIRQGPGDFAYPYATQTRDGKIHLVFTSQSRTVINRAVFDERWLLDAKRPQPRGTPDSAGHVLHHVKVYAEPGRFGGWPANHGIWSWGDEILVGFSAGYFKDNGPTRHAIDHARPEEHLLARSRDGGLTWSIEDPATSGALIPVGKVLHGVTPPGLQEKPWQDCPGGIDFTDPNFALTVRMTDAHAGPARFYHSADRGKTWQGPFRLPLFGQPGIAARTDYLVNGKHDCLLFLTAAKPNRREGRPLCVRTTDGGRTWQFVAWICDEPTGYAIMPATVRLGETELLTAIRRHEGEKNWIETYRSLDDAKSWRLDTTPAPNTGEGNPASMIRLADGRLCLTYGYRAAPYGIRARLSRDGGRSWEPEIILRGDGGGRDLGYPRSVQRTDGKVVTVYYFHDQPLGDRYLVATIWGPNS